MTTAQVRKSLEEDTLAVDRGEDPDPEITDAETSQREPSCDGRDEAEDDKAGEGKTIMPERGPEWDFDDDLFTPGRERVRLTRRQRRVGRRKHADIGTGSPGLTLELSAEELRKLQEGDDTLAVLRKVADGQSSTIAGPGFFRRDGLLYRRWMPPGCNEEGMMVEQLVLPVRCRGVVIKLAHEIPLAGYLGKDKTAKRILQRFYWPTVHKDVAEFCRSCEQCQKSTKRREPKAPLIPLPIVSEPFRRIAMDVVGRSRDIWTPEIFVPPERIFQNFA